MVRVACYNCGTHEAVKYASENGFDLVKCQQCGLLYVNPRPEANEIIEGAEQGLHHGDVDFDLTGRFDPIKCWFYKKVLAELYPNGTPAGSWLDIGCGHGELLATVNSLYHDAVAIRGTEPNVHKQKAAQDRGLNVSYFNLFTHEGKYNIISLLNVYSHLPDPGVFISRCRNMLVPGGELIIQTGDSAHFSPEDHYRPFFLPDHLSFASEQILRDILTRNGFEVISVLHYPVVYRHVVSFAKELLKVVWPRQKSRLKYMFNNKYRTDMFIRARATA